MAGLSSIGLVEEQHVEVGIVEVVASSLRAVVGQHIVVWQHKVFGGFDVEGCLERMECLLLLARLASMAPEVDMARMVRMVHMEYMVVVGMVRMVDTVEGTADMVVDMVSI